MELPRPQTYEIQESGRWVSGTDSCKLSMLETHLQVIQLATTFEGQSSRNTAPKTLHKEDYAPFQGEKKKFLPFH